MADPAGSVKECAAGSLHQMQCIMVQIDIRKVIPP